MRVDSMRVSMQRVRSMSFRFLRVSMIANQYNY